MSGKLNPYQTRMLFDWKNEEVIVEFTNPKTPPIRGKIVEVNVWNDKFLVDTDEGEFWIHGGVRFVKKIISETPELSPEAIPENIRKEYSSTVKS